MFIPHRLIGVLLLACWLGGCASTNSKLRLDTDQAALSELAVRQPIHQLAAPTFFAQRAYHCGPAALAMAMTDLGLAVTPQQAAPLTFMPARRGALQIEMVAAARSLGAFASPIPPRLDALLSEVAAGHGPIVLLNLGLNWAPRWHYASIVGYDLHKQTITLRSGTERKQQMTLFTFGHVWGRAQNWAFSVHRPGELPATASQDKLIEAALAFERVHPGADSLATWRAITHRWPANKIAQIGLGNQAYALGQLTLARRAFQRATKIDSQSTAAWNNLAVILTELGEYDAAEAALQSASAPGQASQRQLAQTRAALRLARRQWQPRAHSERPKSTRP